MPETTDFYEDDEPVVKIRAEWDAAPKRLTRYSDEAIREMMSTTRSDEIRAVLAASLRDPWDACLDVDPFTGQPDHEHGDSCEGCE